MQIDREEFVNVATDSLRLYNPQKATALVEHLLKYVHDKQPITKHEWQETCGFVVLNHGSSFCPTVNVFTEALRSVRRGGDDHKQAKEHTACKWCCGQGQVFWFEDGSEWGFDCTCPNAGDGLRWNAISMEKQNELVDYRRRSIYTRAPGVTHTYTKAQIHDVLQSAMDSLDEWKKRMPRSHALAKPKGEFSSIAGQIALLRKEAIGTKGEEPECPF